MKKNSVTLGLQILRVCFYYMMIIFDVRQHMTVWKQSVSRHSEAPLSSTDTLAVISHLFILIMAIAVIIICCFSSLSLRWILFSNTKHSAVL